MVYGRRRIGKSTKGKIVTLCEVKFTDKEISPKIIPEVEMKVYKLKEILPNYTIKKALITCVGESKALKSSNYFDYSLNAKDLLIHQESA